MSLPPDSRSKPAIDHPLKIVLLARDGITRLPVLVLDASSRPDVLALTRVHGTGTTCKIETLWTTGLGPRLQLVVRFRSPVSCESGIDFEPEH